MTLPGPALRYPINALVSFHYYPDPKVVKNLHDRGLRLIGDSGAFSAQTSGSPIDLDRFTEWCHAVQPWTCWLASLDEIGNERVTWQRWRTLTDSGLDTIPTLHYGCDPKAMDRYVEQGVDMLGLGGMVGRKSEKDRLLRWALGMMRYAKNNHPQVRFHGWGITHPILVESLPWWSVDSSGFGTAYRFGRMNLYDPVAKRTLTFACDGVEPFQHGRLLRQHYTTDPAAIAYSTPATRTAIIRVSARAYQLREDHLRKRHAVEPPTYGVRHPVAGTNMHAVDAAANNLKAMGTNLHLAITSEEKQLDKDAAP